MHPKNTYFPALNRRRFIQYGATFAGSTLLLPLVSHTSLVSAKKIGKTAFWYQQPLRILQTVLRETDAENYDAEAVVGYMQEAGCNTLIVNAGGIVDFFQNPLPAANINPFMGDRDILREITSACQSAGIKVIGRVDFRGVAPSVYQKYPDWFSVDASGNPVQLDYTRPRLYASCYTGYHRNDHAEAFIRYLMEHYALDGIWHNSIGVGGICYCTSCQEAFQSAIGAEIPKPDTASTAELDQYMAWKSQVADQHMEIMKNTVKSFGRDKVYTAEVFSMFEAGGRIHSGIDLYNARDHFDFLVSVAFLTENSEHIQYEDLTYANTIVRFLKSMAPDKEAIILYGGNGTAHRYVMDPPVDLQIWLWEALAGGGRFWNCNFTGMHPNATHDRRNAFNNTEAYQFVKKHEKLLAQQVPVANIGIYYSRPTRLFYREQPQEGDSFEACIQGVVTVLTENHIPYDFIADDQVSPERLRKYQLIILPNVRCLSEAEAALLKNYVRQGGNLMATYASSLYDEEGTERADFALSELFGCHYTGERANTRKDSYQYIAQSEHPLVIPDSEKTELLLNAAYTLLCKPSEDAQVICTHVPTVHNQPPEKAWVEKWSQEFPTVVEHSYGEGRVLYFANQPDQISEEIGHPDARNLLLRGVKYLAGIGIPVESTAPESVHIGLTESAAMPGQYVLSLVNTTSGSLRPVRRLLPVHDIQVTLQLEGKTLERYEVMRTQGACSVEDQGQRINIRISKLEDFCAIHLQMRT
ncbi:MAG: beta-galactosidase trimerization domain-containing protein [Cyclobacteriaceae bacterium]